MGVKNWTKLAATLPELIGKQCPERWRNHLDPNNNYEPWSQQEDELLINLHEAYGNSWVKIAEQIPGRSDNSIKNRWNSTLSKRLGKGFVKNKKGKTPPLEALLPKPENIEESLINQTPRFNSERSTFISPSPFSSFGSLFHSNKAEFIGLSPYQLYSPYPSSFGAELDFEGMNREQKRSLIKEKEDEADLKIRFEKR
jgi:hypothetical protein